MKTDKIHLDFETRSEVDLLKYGLDRYARHPSTKPLMLGWAINDEEPELWLPEHGKLPVRLREGINDPDVKIVAQNAQFEEAIFKHVFGAKISAKRWEDTMIMAYQVSLPGNLFDLCRIVGVKEDQQKLSDGRKLIQLFCVPHKKITKTFPKRWLDAETHPEEFERFKTYCKLDVVSERQVYHKLKRFCDMTEIERAVYELDRRINLYGMPVDPVFVENALGMYKNATALNVESLKRLTGLANPMSNKQMLEWAQQNGYPYHDLRKPTVNKALAESFVLEIDEESGEIITDGISSELRAVLELRAETFKTSLKKFDALRRCTSNTAGDYRFRYGYQYLGAQRTGRWAGRKVQGQNLPRPAKAHEKHLSEITDLVRANNVNTIEEKFGNPLLALSSTIRSSFRAPKGKKFVVADLSAIEDRMIGWLSGCERIMQDHRDGKDPYMSFGVFLFEKTYAEISKRERQDSKPGRLGCGYRLGPGGVVKNKKGDDVKTGLYGYAESLGIQLTLQQCERSVQVYRNAYPEVVQYWYDLENAVERCLQTKRPVKVGAVIIDTKQPFLRIRLPSGRYLHYYSPRMTKVTRMGKNNEPYTKLSFNYLGVDSQTKKWGRIFSHGGKLAENIDQAASRDILAAGMVFADLDGYRIVGHAHDEIITEQDEHDAKHTVERLCKIMCRKLDWCRDLPLAAAGYESVFYKKD